MDSVAAKKWLILVLGLAVLAGLSGCSLLSRWRTPSPPPAAQKEKPRPASPAARPQAAPGQAAASPARLKVKAALLLAGDGIDRLRDGQAQFRQEALSLGLEVIGVETAASQEEQNAQAEALLQAGADVLVVTAREPGRAGGLVKAAHQRNVSVLACERLILDCDLDLHLAFDPVLAGYLQALTLLKAAPQGNWLLLGGPESDGEARLQRQGQLKAINDHERERPGQQINILAAPFLAAWDGALAAAEVGRLLGTGADLAAVVASSDALADGAAEALAGRGLLGRVALAGRDATLSACRRVVRGQQTMTAYLPAGRLAVLAARAARDLAWGRDPVSIIGELKYEVSYLDNGAGQVPTLFLEPTVVTRDNLAQTVIRDGWQKREEVFAGLPREEWPAPAD